MLRAPFLTELDSRAAVKGSRDPLGLVPLWTRLGRHVVGNLTTVTGSVRGFTTLILGYYFVERVADPDGSSSELDTFLKWEQLVAYSRVQNNVAEGVRGLRRTRRNLEQGVVTISAASDHQILGNQKIYGLWGLYSGPARASGLLKGAPARLTPPVRELVESTYLPVLAVAGGKNGQRIVDILREDSFKFDLSKRHAPLAKSLSDLMQSVFLENERDLYREHLAHGGPDDGTHGAQALLGALLDEELDEGVTDEAVVLNTALVRHLAKRASKHHEFGEALAHRLERIAASESVLAPASRLFNYLLGCDGQPVAELASRLKAQWGGYVKTADLEGFRELRGEIAKGASEVDADRWIGIAETMSAGEYRSLVELLVKQNASVMASRGGAPWIEVQDDRFHVRFKEEQGSLPKRDDLPTLWVCPYFLASLASIGGQVERWQDA